MAGMDGCTCGCWQSAEARAMAAKEAEERKADFARYLDDRAAKRFPPLPADRETDALLALVELHGGLPVPVVRTVG